MFPQFPDAARAWTFVFDKELSHQTADALLTRVRSFLDGWTSHGRPVRADTHVVEQRALVVVALIDEAEANAGVSGCGIDSMRSAVESALEALAISLVPVLSLVIETEANWEVLTRAEVRQRAESGSVTAQTRVLDGTAQTLSDLRTTGVVTTVGNSWVGRAIPLSHPAGAAA